MTKRVGFAVAALAVLSALAASCSSGIVGSDYGSVTLTIRPAPGAKALDDDWPWGGPPVFATMTFDVVDGTGASVLEADQPVVSGNTVTIRVRAGTGLRVSFQGEPDWAKTAEAYQVDIATLPAAALGYGGTSAAFDLEIGGTAETTIALALTRTAIVLPNTQDDWRIALATSLDDADPDEYLMGALGLDDRSDFFFDSRGRLYFSYYDSTLADDVVASYGDLDSAALSVFQIFNSPDHVAYDPVSNRMYGYYDSDGASLYFIDLDESEPTLVYVNEPVSYYFELGGLAVDETGTVYAHMVNAAGDHVIAKISIGDPSGSYSDSTVASEVTFESLGLGYIEDTYFYVRRTSDIALVDGRLVLLFEDVNLYGSTDSTSRGFAAAVDPTNLSLLWTSGWSGDAVSYPTDAAAQLYGPVKVIGFRPGSVFVYDEGFSWDGTTFANVDRVVALDLDSGSFSGIGFVDFNLGYISYDNGGWF